MVLMVVLNVCMCVFVGVSCQAPQQRAQKRPQWSREQTGMSPVAGRRKASWVRPHSTVLQQHPCLLHHINISISMVYCFSAGLYMWRYL